MSAGSPANQPAGSGLGVDSGGNPVVDPTANVRELVEAAIKRQDDLRDAALRREDDLRDQESRHVREITELRADYQRQLRQAETERIDAIRAVDVGAVNRAAEVQAIQAATLAKQVADSAEAMRVQVAATATASTVALGAALDPIKNDIADLRRAQYEAQGQKAQVVEHRDGGSPARAWLGIAVAATAVVVSTLLSIAGLIAAYIATH